MNSRKFKTASLALLSVSRGHSDRPSTRICEAEKTKTKQKTPSQQHPVSQVDEEPIGEPMTTHQSLQILERLLACWKQANREENLETTTD